MIVGIGSDLTDIRRIQAALDRFGERFVQRVFTDIERTRSEGKPDRAASYAKRFAARARHRRSQRSGCMNTRFFCRKVGLCSPDDSTKCPWRRAPAARNSSRTSSWVMGRM